MMNGGALPIPKQFADMSMQMLAPKRSVIVEIGRASCRERV